MVNDFNSDAEQPETHSRPSKSRQKREMQALQELSRQLVELPQKTLEKIVKESELMEAILLAKQITMHGGRRRQLLYISKLLRQIDLEGIKQAVTELNVQHQTANQQFHHLEQWRDTLIREGDLALEKLLEQHQNLDRQQMRQLIRSAQKEAQSNKPPKSSRALFRYLKEHLTEGKA